MSNLATSEHLPSYLGDLAYSTNLSVPSYTSLTDIISVTPQNLETGEAEDTQLQSANATKEFGPGWHTPGEVEVECYLVGPQDRTLQGFQVARTMLLLRHKLPPLSTQTVGDTATFKGFIKSWKPSQYKAGDDERMKVTYTVKINGVVTLAAGS